MIIPIFIIGLISSIVTEILKLFPVLSETDARKKTVAFLVALILSLTYVAGSEEYIGLGGFALVIGAIGASFTVYKSVIQVFRKPEAKAEGN